MPTDLLRVVYGLIDPRNGELRYVGKTTHGFRRIREHWTPSKMRAAIKRRSAKWVAGLLKHGLKPEVEILEADPADLAAAEQFWIAYFRFVGCNLTNHTAGGEGVSGWSPSEETRRKISAARKGRPGQPHTEEHKQRMSALLSGRVRGPMGAEFSAKMSRALKGRPKSRAHAEAIGAALLGRSKTTAERLALSRALGGRPFVDENGTRYETLGEASRALGVNVGQISQVLRGLNRHAKGHRFTFIEAADAH
jgi:hypothetical protein